jgi:hypothetical protein
MKKNNQKHAQNQRGFTLLLAALVASITLSLGAAIYSITLKQLTLSGIGRDSQFAFYAADTSAECALYWDIRQGAFNTTTPPATITCDGTTIPVTATSYNSSGGSSGSWYSASAGCVPGGATCSFTVPSNFASLTVTVFGAGGGGGGGAICNVNAGNVNNVNGTGGVTTFSTMSAPGGGRGNGAPLTCGAATNGTNGVGTGGDTNGSSAGTGGAGGPDSGGSTGTCAFGSSISGGQCRGYLTSGTSWTVPSDWTNTNTIEVIGGGGSGNSVLLTSQAGAGGGGAYSRSTITTLSAGANVSYNVGVGGAAVTGNTTANGGGDTWFGATSFANCVAAGPSACVGAKGASAVTSGVGGVGGAAASGVGAVKFSGGNGFALSNPIGGGGAAGPSGAGGNGTSLQGGNADNNVLAGPTGSSAGRDGTEWDAVHGSGTGAYRGAISTAYAGGKYGGGGVAVASSMASGTGLQGIIVITYTPSVGATLTGGTGGLGGYAQKTYCITGCSNTLTPGQVFTVSEGAAGVGASIGSGYSAGSDGLYGHVDITWTGGPPVWDHTDFQFNSDLSGVDCADTTLTKTKNGAAISTTINSNGYNTLCSSRPIDPRALQRSVQLKY